jgi:hypothetical protein
LAPAGAKVAILYKPFASTRDWSAVDATGKGTLWTATVSGSPGALFAAEITAPGIDSAWRYPDALTTTPYVSLPP